MFHRISAGTTTSAISVTMVDTVAVWAMIRKTSGGAHPPCPLMIRDGVPGFVSGVSVVLLKCAVAYRGTGLGCNM